MRRLIAVLTALQVACGQASTEQPGARVEPFGFEGVAYSSATDQIIHGERLADVLLCTACHMPDLGGADFGAGIPELEGLYATNISLTMPAMSDAELERILRDGVHPTREALYVMPSKSYQHMTEPDMAALIAFLRTVPPTGEPTPLPNLKGEIADRLARGEYHSAADEVTHFAENPPPDLGETHRLGRYIAMAVCTGCHGARMDGAGEFGGGMAAVADYDDAELHRFLADGVPRDGREIRMHGATRLTEHELAAVLAYTKELARLQKR